MGIEPGYRQVLAETLAGVAAETGLPLTGDQPEELADSLPSWPPFPEVPAALEALRGHGWRLGILSNTDPDLLAASVDNIGVPVDVHVAATTSRRPRSSVLPPYGSTARAARPIAARRATCRARPNCRTWRRCRTPSTGSFLPVS